MQVERTLGVDLDSEILKAAVFQGAPSQVLECAQKGRYLKDGDIDENGELKGINEIPQMKGSPLRLGRVIKGVQLAYRKAIGAESL